MERDYLTRLAQRGAGSPYRSILVLELICLCLVLFVPGLVFFISLSPSLAFFVYLCVSVYPCMSLSVLLAAQPV